MTQYARYPGYENVRLYDANGNPISSSGGALDVNVVGGGSALNPFDTGTPVLTPVSPVSSIISAANVTRLFLRVSNFSASIVWLQYGADAEVSRGVRLNTNTIFELNSTELYTGAVHAISSGGTVDVDVFEGTA